MGCGICQGNCRLENGPDKPKLIPQGGQHPRRLRSVNEFGVAEDTGRNACATMSYNPNGRPEVIAVNAAAQLECRELKGQLW